MKNITLFLFVFVLLSCVNQSAEMKAQKEETQAESFVVSALEKLAGGFKFTEGPAVDAHGNVYFTDIPNHLILIWTVEDQLDTFKTNRPPIWQARAALRASCAPHDGNRHSQAHRQPRSAPYPTARADAPSSGFPRHQARGQPWPIAPRPNRQTVCLRAGPAFHRPSK